MILNHQLIAPEVTLVTEPDLTKKIERAYRICYKSEDKITDTSDVLVTRFLQSREPIRHTSPAEHGWVEFEIDMKSDSGELFESICHTLSHWRTRLGIHPMLTKNCNTIATNVRVLHDFLIDMSTVDADGRWCYSLKAAYAVAKLLHDAYPKMFTEPVYDYEDCEPCCENNPKLDLSGITVKEYTDYRTFHIITTRDILQEFARHRSLSFSVESTRYCNYDKKGLLFTLPYPYIWTDKVVDKLTDESAEDYIRSNFNQGRDGIVDEFGDLVGSRIRVYDMFESIDSLNSMSDVYAMMMAFSSALYRKALSIGARPQEARMILPGALKTEMIVTGTLAQWEHFLLLRDHEDAHPQIRHIARKIKQLI